MVGTHRPSIADNAVSGDSGSTLLALLMARAPTPRATLRLLLPYALLPYALILLILLLLMHALL